MKQIQNIGRVLLSLLVFGLVSCSQNDEWYNSNSNNGTEVPEGYMLVSFPIEDEVSTRAETNPVTGGQKRIQHLQYLLYKKPDSGSDTETDAWILEKKEEIEENASGIYFPKTFNLQLPIGNEYKIVFLANVKESLFENQSNTLLEDVEVGTSTYSDAVINAPDVAFGENNMYYLASVTFNTQKEEEESARKDVTGVCLQRMVSRSVLTTYGIQGEYDKTEQTYAGRFYSSLLNDNATIGKVVFGNDIESALGKQFHQLIMEDIVYPFAYLLDLNSTLTNDDMKTWFNEAQTSFEEHYKARGITIDDLNSTLTALKSEASDFTDINPEKAAALQSFILSLKNNDAQNNYIGKMLAKVKEMDIKDIRNTSVGTFTIAKQKTAEQLEESSLFATWSEQENNNITMTAQLSGKVPTAVDLDLNVKGTSESFSRDIALVKATDTEDSTLPIVLLADKAGSYSFGLSSLAGSKSLQPMPEGGISEGKALLPNISTTYRVTPTDVKWDEAVTTESKKIIIAYGSLIATIGELGGNVTKSNLETDLKIALSAVYNINRKDIIFTLDDGRLTDGIGSHNTITEFNFPIPDFSSNHLKGTWKWKWETEK